MSDHPLSVPQILRALEKALGSEDPSPPSAFHILTTTLHVTLQAANFQPRPLEGEEETAGVHEASTIHSALPREGTNSKDNDATFQYTHPQSSLTFLVKHIRLWDKMLVVVSVKETGKTFTVEINPKDYITPSEPSSQEAKRLEKAFEGSPKSLADLLDLIKVQLIQPMIPDLVQAGYEVPPGRGAASHHQSPGIRPNSSRERHSSHQSNPMAVGESDVNPLGPYPLGGPLPGTLGPGDGGGGMLVGPNHPMFFGGGTEPESGPTQPFSGEGVVRLPPGAVPPGARFDPISPLNPPSTHRPGRGRGYGRGSGESRPFSGDPDNDELPPPGYHDFYM
ncbi:hypothetical protein BJ684DRAFT_20210 [Piptocephalis cylindrospora]|uniref:Uncharacterized protein n=1 Tax=Piptocephalis cylindrospora TaxID=1907219 RepID=A0A4P9Y529_9FUNG|nr:hypothetical protein BJ684DRAFT_20210 [Piptocephalis cylindrospora]|eukprot:RKP13281.1 hypothetical protein BJ684DRAFT_20210 [Piptocephalis cylindrospora]